MCANAKSLVNTKLCQSDSKYTRIILIMYTNIHCNTKLCIENHTLISEDGRRQTKIKLSLLVTVPLLNL